MRHSSLTLHDRPPKQSPNGFRPAHCQWHTSGWMVPLRISEKKTLFDIAESLRYHFNDMTNLTHHRYSLDTNSFPNQVCCQWNKCWFDFLDFPPPICRWTIQIRRIRLLCVRLPFSIWIFTPWKLDGAYLCIVPNNSNEFRFLSFECFTNSR